MNIPQAFITTVQHPEDKILRWNILVVPDDDGKLREVAGWQMLGSDGYNVEELPLSPSALPFVIASMLLTESGEAGPSDDMLSAARTLCKSLLEPDGNERRDAAMELAEHILYKSPVPVYGGPRWINSSSLTDIAYRDDESSISLVRSPEGQKSEQFILVRSRNGILLGAAGPITIIERIWEKLREWM